MFDLLRRYLFGDGLRWIEVGQIVNDGIGKNRADFRVEPVSRFELLFEDLRLRYRQNIRRFDGVDGLIP